MNNWKNETGIYMCNCGRNIALKLKVVEEIKDSHCPLPPPMPEASRRVPGGDG